MTRLGGELLGGRVVANCMEVMVIMSQHVVVIYSPGCLYNYKLCTVPLCTCTMFHSSRLRCASDLPLGGGPPQGPQL